MAGKYTWPDGSKHSITWSQEQANRQAKSAPAKGNPAPAVPTSNPLIEGAYGISTGNALNSYNDTNTQITQGENQLGSDYGYNIVRNSDGTVDQNATLNGTPQDASVNPFSKMAMLSHAYQNAQRGTTNSYAAQGQLYSSAIANQRGTDQYNNDAAVDAAKKAFQSSLQADQSARSGAGNDYASGLGSAAWARTNAYLGGG